METSKGTMELELYAARAPRTVERFMKAVDSGAYDGLRFHRIIQDFMIQGEIPWETARAAAMCHSRARMLSTSVVSSAWLLSERESTSRTCSSSS